MYINRMRSLMVGVVAAALLAGYGSHAASQQKSPFTREVEEFVDIYLKHGGDKLTVLEDTDGDGRFESQKDVITGLNTTTSVLTGRGGVWVMNPPYLLFYRDRTGDGLPDGDPEVRLEGFGLEDTHSLANSLTWGPDGWLYGVHGSTSTGRVRGISFLGQAVWRYHPDSDAFELFAEGGGNPWTLSFDSGGRAFSGDNGGNSRGFHWVPCGRIWRLRARDHRPVAPLDLARRSSQELVGLLGDDRKWYREQARRLLGE